MFANNACHHRVFKWTFFQKFSRSDSQIFILPWVRPKVDDPNGIKGNRRLSVKVFHSLGRSCFIWPLSNRQGRSIFFVGVSTFWFQYRPFLVFQTVQFEIWSLTFSRLECPVEPAVGSLMDCPLWPKAVHSRLNPDLVYVT